MNEEEIQAMVQELWEKYAHPYQHGHKDWMSEDSFDSAIRDALLRRDQHG